MIVDLSGFATGVCDRLRQLTFCAALAKELGDNVLEIYELASSQSVGFLSNLFALDGFSLLTLQQQPKGTHIRMSPFDSLPSLEACAAHLPPEFHIDPSDFYNKWLTAYTMLKPSQHVFSSSRSLSLRYDLGVHLRVTDKLVGIPSKGCITWSQFNKFAYHFLPQYLKSFGRDFKVYLASDSESSFNAVVNRISPFVNVYYSPFGWHKHGIRHTGGDAFVYDLFSLANSSNIVSTTGGGIPLTARLIAGCSPSSFKAWTSECCSTRTVEALRFTKRLLLNYFAHSRMLDSNP